ncbi:LptF/LptG family permease [Cognataquiflexum rubidum]|uniref:LptF/LptG family permease n=1 Tax=Cognataquiflexum rubidum TaxID=2922273 RepID=UPI001F12BBD7|nr:LptF/LptG family permease [Cognataquiflexum rubidum]MCH6236357.1 LptF/LptG family permease [Cognataquiflexum rubidum]
MKKIDKLILGSFIGPFFLTFVVVDFILLTVNMLKYFDEIFGKGLSFWIYMELFSYFVISISPMALPLAVLLSALMTFGNLGEHFELTALKSAGISLVRALMPIGVFVLLLTIAAFLSNNYLVPKVNLKTFGLLYDIRMKSPALDIKEGVFYNGIPNYSIKVNRKLDEVRLNDIIIYNHADGQGNINVIMADSGRMEPFFNNNYMKLTLYNGVSYKESRSQRGITEKPADLSRTLFSENQIVFDLASFQLNRTPEDLWSTNRSIKNIAQLKLGLDSMNSEINQIVYYNYLNTESSFPYFTRDRKLSPPLEVVRRKERDDSIKIAKAGLQKKAEEAVLSGSKSMDSLNLMAFPKGADSMITLDRELIFQKDSIPDLSKIESIVNNKTANGSNDTSINVDRNVPKRNINRKVLKINAPTTAIDSLVPKSNIDSIVSPGNTPNNTITPQKTAVFTDAKRAAMDSIISKGDYNSKAATVGMNNARTIKNNFSTKLTQVDALEREFRRFEIAWYQKYTTAFACIVMFMIGAPLGAIIKKGGLGMPVLMSIIFFILFYMLTITGEKWAKEGITNTVFGTWFSNLVLLPFGFFFLRQARKDARLFEPDTYTNFFKKIKAKFTVKPAKSQA